MKLVPLVIDEGYDRFFQPGLTPDDGPRTLGEMRRHAHGVR